MLRYPTLCCCGVQNKMLGVSDFNATWANPEEASNREQSASVILEMGMGILPREAYGQYFFEASAAPSANDLSLANATLGSTPLEPTWMLNSQSTPATTLFRPTRSPSPPMPRTPGASTLPSGWLMCSKIEYSCAWRVLAATNRMVRGLALHTRSMMSLNGT